MCLKQHRLVRCINGLHKRNVTKAVRLLGVDVSGPDTWESCPESTHFFHVGDVVVPHGIQDLNVYPTETEFVVSFPCRQTGFSLNQDRTCSQSTSRQVHCLRSNEANWEYRTRGVRYVELVESNGYLFFNTWIMRGSIIK